MSTIRIPTPLRAITGGKDEVTIHGSNVREVLEGLCQEFGGIRDRIYDEEGNIRRFVNVFVNSDDIRQLQGLQTVVATRDTISLVPAIAGGAGSIERAEVSR